ncbi:MAG: hypothetical protein KAX46_00500 [Chromatiaceae bacterium]|nr:hypothetical protein [Chromatiaceae bacterium]
MAVSRCLYEDVVTVYADQFDEITILVRSAQFPPDDGPVSWKKTSVSIGRNDIVGVIEALQDVLAEKIRIEESDALEDASKSSVLNP